MKTHLLLALALLLASLTTPPASANDTVFINIASPSATSPAYTFAAGILTLTAPGPYVITGSTSENRVIVAKNLSADITLRNVSITSSTASPFALSDSADITLHIAGHDTLATTSGAGLLLDGANAVLTIEGSSRDSLTATGSQGAAGIGGTYQRSSGTIIINSGNITATGGDYAAGIGGGSQGEAGKVIINGGNVMATGGAVAGGIGAGEYMLCDVTINGGIVKATSKGGGAGIGSGRYVERAAPIRINGGVVMAWGGSAASDIGCSYNYTAPAITITGGQVFACGNGSIGGGGYMMSGGSFTMTGGTLVAGTIVSNANSISGNAVILTNTLTPDTDYGTANVTTGLTLSPAIIQAMGENAAASATADTTLIIYEKRDTFEFPDTFIHDTLTNTTLIHDTIHEGTDSLHDTVRFDPDSLHDTIYADITFIHDTITDTLLIYDTLYFADTVWQEAEVFDTTLIPIDVYDTTHIPINIIDTTRIPDTIILRDTVVIWNDIPIPLYIVVDPILGTQTVVTDDAPIISAANGLLLTSLTPNAPFAIYSIDGSLVVRTTATPAGTYHFTTLPPATYLLYHASRWSKFTHN